MRDKPSWPVFTAYAVAGAVFATGVLSILTVGPFLLLGALVLIGFLLGTVGPRADAVGVLSGVGVPALYVAWLNRHGPGTWCTADGCGEQWSPWPFVVVGVVLLAAGVVVRLRMRDDA